MVVHHQIGNSGANALEMQSLESYVCFFCIMLHLDHGSICLQWIISKVLPHIS